MKSLRKLQGDVRRRGCSGPRLFRFGGRWEAGWDFGPIAAAAAAGPALGWAGPLVWRVEAHAVKTEVLALRGGGAGAEVPRGDVNSFHSSVARAGGWQRGILCSKTPFPTCCVTWGQSLLLSEPQDHLTFGQCSSDFPSLACAGKQAARQSLPWGEEWCAYWGPVAPGPVPSPGYGSGCAQSRRPGEPRPPGEGDADEVPGKGTRFFPPKPCAAQKANC